MTEPTIAFIYLQSTRPERLRASLTDAIAIFGPSTVCDLIHSIRKACKGAQERNISRPMQYKFSIITLKHFGINGPPASAIIKEAWNPGSLIDQIAFNLHAQDATHSEVAGTTSH